jgi:hypothetical protein
MVADKLRLMPWRRLLTALPAGQEQACHSVLEMGAWVVIAAWVVSPHVYAGGAPAKQTSWHGCTAQLPLPCVRFLTLSHSHYLCVGGIWTSQESK